VRSRTFLLKRQHLRGRPMQVRSPGPLGVAEQEDLFATNVGHGRYSDASPLLPGRERNPTYSPMVAISLSFIRRMTVSCE
jgi:hypothetical protein